MDAWAWRERTVKEMLALGLDAQGAAAETRRAEARLAVRAAWVRSQIAALREAYRMLDAAWEQLLSADPEAEGPPPEQAEVDRILAEIEAVMEQDRWPRHLHWGDV